MEDSHAVAVDGESLRRPADGKKKKGGWITFPFIATALIGFGLAAGGATGNLVVYLVTEYHVPSVDAAQISTIVNGCISVAPVAGAIVADAFFGCFPVIAVAMAFAVLALVVFTLTASVPGLRPAACAAPPGCEAATAGQMAALYAGVVLMCVSAAGARFNQATMGADQFDALADRDVFFNWYFIFFYGSAILGSTVIVYVQDAVSWELGYGLAGAAAVVGLAALLLGARYYRRPAIRGSPFTGIARVVVAAVRKRKLNVVAASEKLTFYYGGRGGDVVHDDGGGKGSDDVNVAPSDSFSFLNRAAVITDGDIDDDDAAAEDGAKIRPWRVCTVRQVEDLKAVLRILPLWISSIFLSVSIGVQLNFSVLQALAMDRAVAGGRFTVPAGSMIVGNLAGVVVFLGLIDRALLPLWRSLTGGHVPTPLQRIGAGHVLTVLSMAASALVERGRLATVHAHGEEANPNTATGMVAMIVALGFYLSTALVDIVRRATAWLPDNMNASRLENLYWLLAVLVFLNFGYYLTCAKLYKYQNFAM
uniref:Uncharacterized protein n=1 Tax=Leersia perrieri TaxID=77586 RepID=A0A0D9WF96_9ORYZ